MEIISNPTPDEIARAAKALVDGRLVAFPTETVYGLGADATNELAIRRIYLVKGRPIDHPLIVHIASIKQLDQWADDIPEYALRLAEKFWPGPLTLILKRSILAKNFITGGQESIGVRVPFHPVALKLLTEFEKRGGIGIAAPSANRFGLVSPTSSIDVQNELGKYLSATDLILNGGKCNIGVESTILDCTSKVPAIIRPGAVTSEMMQKLIGFDSISIIKKSKTKSAGTLKSHYAPAARVLVGKKAKPGYGFIALSEVPTPNGAIRLAQPKTIKQYAKILYGALRLGDSKGLENIVVIPPDGNGLAIAIRDRLIKASNHKKIFN